MTISIVTGGAGFIGSHIVEKLKQLDHMVVVVDNEYSDNDNFHWRKDTLNVDIDITDYKGLKNAFTGADYVFHLAAEARIQPAVLNPIEAVSINSVGTCTVLQFAREAKVKRVIYSSTSSGYGLNEPPNVEAQPDDCLNPYSVSKVNGEKLCSMYTNLFGVKTIILRYFNVYGNRHPLKGQYAPVIGIFLRQLRDEEPLTIVGDGEQRRDFTNVLDVVDANILAATKQLDDDAFGQVYNVGTGINHSINEIASMISDNTEYIPPRLGEARITLAHNSRIKGTLGWEPKIKLEDWIESALPKDETEEPKNPIRESFSKFTNWLYGS